MTTRGPVRADGDNRRWAQLANAGRAGLAVIALISALSVVLGMGGCHGRPPVRPAGSSGPPVRSRAASSDEKLAASRGPEEVPRRPAREVGKAAASALRAQARAANVVICVLDAARADGVGCYGYPRNTTPNIDELARDSVVFRRHFSTCSLTTPSTASLFTGLYVDAHCIHERGALDDRIVTLAEGLRQVGMRTAVLSSNVSASPEAGLGAGFDYVFPRPGSRGGVGKGRAERGGEWWRAPGALTRELAKWLDEEHPKRFFAYLHFLPPHAPYKAPDAFVDAVAAVRVPPSRPGRFDFPEVERAQRGSGPNQMPFPLGTWTDLYDANLRWGDWGVGEVIRLLRERNLLDNTLLIVTSDHGEAFGEHGYINHMLAVYDELVHIPLVIRFPGEKAVVGDVFALTQTVDLLPTIFDLFGVGWKQDAIQGRSLLPLLDGSRKQIRDFVFARSHGAWPSYLVRNSEWSLILYQGGELRALYDLRRDPKQLRNVIAQRPETAARLAEVFTAFARTQAHPLAEFMSPEAATSAPRPKRELPESVRRELKALGYVD